MARTQTKPTLMRKLADVGDAGSLSNRLRSRRFASFEALVAKLRHGRDEPLRILDVGGTAGFWERRGWADHPGVQITTVNLQAEEAAHPNIDALVGDATSLAEHDDHSFDIAFSNSVIEHLRNLDAQRRMAAAVRRVAPYYWIQTPNYWFPVEPHFLTPGWQYLPKSTRVALLKRRRFGWRGPLPDERDAREAVDEIRLLRAGELRELFPDGELVRERLGPVVKSFVVIREP